MDRALFMPKKRADNESLLDAARGMAQAAARRPDEFIEHGMPKDFLEQFRAETSALADALGVRVEFQRRRTVATQSVAQLVKRGQVAVQLLDTIVKPRLANDPVLLASWRRVKRPIEPGGAPSAGVGDEVSTPVTVPHAFQATQGDFKVRQEICKSLTDRVICPTLTLGLPGNVGLNRQLSW